jgi:hypothetical protein
MSAVLPMVSQSNGALAAAPIVKDLWLTQQEGIQRDICNNNYIKNY